MEKCEVKKWGRALGVLVAAGALSLGGMTAPTQAQTTGPRDSRTEVGLTPSGQTEDPGADQVTEVSATEGQAATVAGLPEIAPETVIPAAPAPSGAGTRSSGAVLDTTVPTGRGGAAQHCHQGNWHREESS